MNSWARSVKTNAPLIVILIIAAVLRLYHVDYQSLWLDEIHTINESNPILSLSEFYKSLCESDPHPPLYFGLVKLAFTLFGYTSFTARVLSALIGVTGVWAIYILGKEIYSKEAGLFSAFLLSFNYFHIYYSQDARPYPLLFVTTSLSFYFLVRFIKTPTIRNTILYAFFAGLMLYTHLFSLFALCSQCFILLYYVLKPYHDSITVKRMFLRCLLAGLIVLLMYLPCLEIFMLAATRTSIWIPEPKPDVYIELIKEFFGNFDIQLVFVVLSVTFFIVAMIREKMRDGKDGALKTSGLILFTWILITLIVPLVRSYMSLPVIVSRYFINILPAVFLLIAIGILQIKYSMARYALLIIMAALSLFNIVVKKDYYNDVKKTQFREATHFIAERNVGNIPVVTSLGWYMPFYLDNDTIQLPIVNKPLDEYVARMMKDSSLIKPFWYIDGHIRPYAPSPEIKQFLDDKFSIEESYDGYDIWTKFYKPSKGNVIKGFGELKTENGEHVNYNVEKFKQHGDLLITSGWAMFSDVNSSKSKVRVCLVKDNLVIPLSTNGVHRPDVTSYFKLNYNADDSGFNCEVNLKNVTPGTYFMALFVENKQIGKRGLTITDKIIQID